MKIGVISDSHGRLGAVRTAAAILQEREIDQLLFCGDIGADEVLETLRNFHVHFVFGNVDTGGERELNKAAARFGHVSHDRFCELELEGVKIAMLHGDNLIRLNQSIDSGSYDLVCHGHTHEVRKEYVGKTLVLNPGALYRASPRSFAVVELPSLMVEIVRLPETTSM